MLFTTGAFMLFFTLFIIGYAYIYPKNYGRTIYVILFSLFFYYKSSGFNLIILLFSIVLDYYVANWIYESDSAVRRKRLMILSITANILLLAYFKYTNFLIENIYWIAGKSFDPFHIFLPIGISFYTFQTISYIIDVYKGEIKPTQNLRDYTFYMTFFPHLVAGPIVRARDFLPQMQGIPNVNTQNINEGLYLIFKGFVKKAIVADYICQYNDLIFGNPSGYSGFENLMAMYGYTLQIYCDFSGYTDMAIGFALIMGYRLLDNFRSPYQATNITDFWRRWHISLSAWLKDYVYINLGGNRFRSRWTWGICGTFGIGLLVFGFVLSNVWMIIGAFILALAVLIPYGLSAQNPSLLSSNLNQLATMIIGGLWHGASWRFIVWGTAHGLGLVIHKSFLHLTKNKNIPFFKTSTWDFLSWIFTFHFIAILWIFFRANTFEQGLQMIDKIFFFFFFAFISPFLYTRTLFTAMLLLASLVVMMPIPWKEKIANYIAEMPVVTKALGLLLLIHLSLQLQSANIQPFIYFQF